MRGFPLLNLLIDNNPIQADYTTKGKRKGGFVVPHRGNAAFVPETGNAGGSPLSHCDDARIAPFGAAPQKYDSTRMPVAPTVGVVIANHNNSDFIAKAIESVARQTVRNIRAVIVDDASTDRSDETIRECLSQLGDARFRYIKLESNVGQGGAAWPNWTRRSSASSIRTTCGTTTSLPGISPRT
jgi:Glycosyl transferase family 2